MSYTLDDDDFANLQVIDPDLEFFSGQDGTISAFLPPEVNYEGIFSGARIGALKVEDGMSGGSSASFIPKFSRTNPIYHILISWMNKVGMENSVGEFIDYLGLTEHITTEEMESLIERKAFPSRNLLRYFYISYRNEEDYDRSFLRSLSYKVAIYDSLVGLFEGRKTNIVELPNTALISQSPITFLLWKARLSTGDSMIEFVKRIDISGYSNYAEYEKGLRKAPIAKFQNAMKVAEFDDIKLQYGGHEKTAKQIYDDYYGNAKLLEAAKEANSFADLIQVLNVNNLHSPSVARNLTGVSSAKARLYIEGLAVPEKTEMLKMVKSDIFVSNYCDLKEELAEIVEEKAESWTSQWKDNLGQALKRARYIKGSYTIAKTPYHKAMPCDTIKEVRAKNALLAAISLLERNGRGCNIFANEYVDSILSEDDKAYVSYISLFEHNVTSDKVSAIEKSFDANKIGSDLADNYIRIFKGFVCLRNLNLYHPNVAKEIVAQYSSRLKSFEYMRVYSESFLGEDRVNLRDTVDKRINNPAVNLTSIPNKEVFVRMVETISSSSVEVDAQEFSSQFASDIEFILSVARAKIAKQIKFPEGVPEPQEEIQVIKHSAVAKKMVPKRKSSWVSQATERADLAVAV